MVLPQDPSTSTYGVRRGDRLDVRKLRAHVHLRAECLDHGLRTQNKIERMKGRFRSCRVTQAALNSSWRRNRVTAH